MPRGEKGLAAACSMRSMKKPATMNVKRACLPEIRAYTTTLFRVLAEAACRHCPQNAHGSWRQGLVAAFPPGLAGRPGRRFRHLQRNLQRAHLLGHRVEDTHPEKYLAGRQIDLLEKLELFLL